MDGNEPVSEVDAMEQQIASQLEQDLELAMDLDITDASHGPMTRMRKRKREDAGCAGPERAKRVSPSTRQMAPSKTMTQSGEQERSESIVDAGAPRLEVVAVEPTSHCRRTSSKTRRGRWPRKTRSSPTTTKDPKLSSEKVYPGARNPKRRRSLRLSGQSFPENGEATADTDSQPCDTTNEHGESAGPGLPEKGAELTVEIDRGNTHGIPREQVHDMDIEGTTSPAGQNVREPDITGEPPEVGILASLRAVLSSIKTAAFGRSVLKEIDDVMFDIKVEAHDAARRHGN
jgi:hypothetical protein